MTVGIVMTVYALVVLKPPSKSFFYLGCKYGTLCAIFRRKADLDSN